MPAEDTDTHVVPLQAVLLADSFTLTFRPASSTVPKVLSPLNNVTLLDYAIEWLASNGVEELFIFAIRHCEMIESYVNSYVNSSTWNSSIRVTTLSDSTLTNPGDALRELDKLDLVKVSPGACFGFCNTER